MASDAIFGEDRLAGRDVDALLGRRAGQRAYVVGDLLDLVGFQDELVDAIAATGRPIVAILFNGRPISIGNVAAKAPAIFECWYLGQELSLIHI